MIHTIKTRKHGTVTFFMNSDGGYIYLETANRPGILGKQICAGGDFTGSTLRATPDTFAAVCRKWHRQRLAALEACAKYGMTYAREGAAAMTKHDDQNIPALRITEFGALDRATLGRVTGTDTYADTAGNLLADTGRTQELMGWGEMDGQARILRDEWGRDAYYIH